MSAGVLLIGHGTRDKNGCAQFHAFAEAVSERLPDIPLQPCFLEHAWPGMSAGIDRLVAVGVDQLIAMPLFLFAAGHAKIDVPRHLKEAESRYPELSVRCGRVLGVECQLARASIHALKAVGGARADTHVLLVGRGSSDPMANSGLGDMARMIWEAIDCSGVEYAYCDVARPSIDDGIRRCLNLGARRVVILPYFLFRGVLMDRLRQHLAGTALKNPGVEFLFAGGNGLASFPAVIDLVVDRVREFQERVGQATRLSRGCTGAVWRATYRHGLPPLPAGMSGEGFDGEA